MVQPAFIICCGSKSEDRETKTISFFNVIESIGLDIPENLPTQEKAKFQHAGRISAEIVSSWLIEPEDYGELFECHFSIRSPSGETMYPRDLPPFSLKSDDTAHMHRVTVRLHGLPPLTEKGIWRFQMDIRRVGAEPWQSQSYPFYVDPSDGYISAVKNA